MAHSKDYEKVNALFKKQKRDEKTLMQTIYSKM